MKRGITAPRGFLASGISCGIKKGRKKDLALIYAKYPAVVVGMTTKNKVAAAPVIYSRKILKKKTAQAIVINSGNANAFTGKKGFKNAQRMSDVASKALGIKRDLVLVASTGIIGKQLPIEKVEKGIINAAKRLSERSNSAANAILTTDRWKKEYQKSLQLNCGKVTIGAMAKGGGMIAPDMATMLAFLTTDANVNSMLLKKVLKEAVDKSFNLITVDGDTSTNDMVIFMANGVSCKESIKDGSRDYFKFKTAVEDICLELAKEIVKDGEGTKKLIKLKVQGAKTENEAALAARTILSSILVKTAFYGNKLNLGRIVAALGRSNVKFNPEKIKLKIGSKIVIENGNIKKISRNITIDKKEVELNLDLKKGQKSVIAYGCDLGFDYLKVNIAYN